MTDKTNLDKGKQLCKQYNKLKKAIAGQEAIKEQEINNVREPSIKSSLDYSEHSNEISKPTENMAIRWAERIDQIILAYDSKLKTKYEQITHIEAIASNCGLDEMEAVIFESRYPKQMKVEEIAKLIGYSERQTKRFIQAIHEKIGANNEQRD